MEGGGTNAQGYLLYPGCPGGSPGAVRFILTVNEGDSISVDLGIDGVDGINAQNSPYGGTSGSISYFYINGVNLISISGGVGGAPMSYCGNTGCCQSPATAQQNNGDILYPSNYDNYPIFVIGTTDNMYSNTTSLFIKY